MAELHRKYNCNFWFELFYLGFSYNYDEIGFFKEFLPDNVHFQLNNAGLMPFDTIISTINKDSLKDGVKKSVLPRIFSNKEQELLYGRNIDQIICDYVPGRKSFCEISNNTLCLDCHGDAFLCCVTSYNNEFKVGNILRDSISDLTRRVLKHNFCKICKSYNLIGL